VHVLPAWLGSRSRQKQKQEQEQEQAVKDDLSRYRVASHVYCHAFVHAPAMLSAANALAGSGS
jgi:hypothetical protein